MSEVKTENCGAQVLYGCLRARTIESKVTAKKQLLMKTPEGLSKEELPALLAAIGTEECPEELKAIAVVNGRKDVYYYESTLMTSQYAELDAMIQEKDILHTIATVTRSDCELYLVPTQFSKLRDYPFFFSEDEILGAAARFTLDPQYADIKVVEASNGGKGFYTTKEMDERYAKARIEHVEVELHTWQ